MNVHWLAWQAMPVAFNIVVLQLVVQLPHALTFDVVSVSHPVLPFAQCAKPVLHVHLQEPALQ